MQPLNRVTHSSRASTPLLCATTRSIPATATSAFRRSPAPAPHRQRWKVRANDRVPDGQLAPEFWGMDAGTHVIAGALRHDGKTTVTTTGYYRAQSGDAASAQVYAHRGRRPARPCGACARTMPPMSRGPWPITS